MFVLIFVMAVCVNTSGTTCVANKIFEVKQVCGRVADPTDVPIQGSEVDLLDSHSNICGRHSRMRAEY